MSFVATRSPMRCIPQAVRVAYTYSENFSLFARSRREAASLTIRTVALVEVHAGASERGPLGEPGDALFELPVQVDQKLRSWPALSSAPDRGTSETSWPPSDEGERLFGEAEVRHSVACGGPVASVGPRVAPPGGLLAGGRRQGLAQHTLYGTRRHMRVSADISVPRPHPGA